MKCSFVRLPQGTERFRAAAAARVTSPLLVQRRSNQEETTPRWRALRASCPAGARAGSGVFRRDSCPGEKLARIRAGHPADFPPPARRAIGAPGRAARSQRAEATARAPHPSPPLRAGEGENSQVCGASLLLLLLARTMRACSSRGPSAAVSRGRQGRAAGIAMEGDAFSTGQEARPKSPATAHGLSVHGRTESAAAGCPFSLATFSLGTQRESSSGAGRRPKARRRRAQLRK